MLLSTLPTIPGRNYEVRGVVFSQATLGVIGGGKLDKMFNTIVKQASDMGADAIVDIKMTAPGGDSGFVVVIGTAVKLR